ncbi:MAG: helix-hairpin-helix domain-containing protein [Terriglobia bacterium]|jgi:competence protein ComEA
MSGIQAAIILFSLIIAPTALAARANSPQKARTHPVARVVDINQAPAEDLEKLPGIGPKLAQQIIAYRTKHGPFHRIEDLLIIKGIGSKKWQALRPCVCVGCGAAK